MKCMFEDAGLQSAILFKKETGRSASLSLVPISFGSCFCFFIFFFPYTQANFAKTDINIKHKTIVTRL